MDDKQRERMQLECLYDMFRDKIEENVIYIVYTENEAKIETTIDQLMSIAACSLTGYHFEPSPVARTGSPLNGYNDGRNNISTNSADSGRSSSASPKICDQTNNNFTRISRHSRHNSCPSVQKGPQTLAKDQRTKAKEGKTVNGDADGVSGLGGQVEDFHDYEDDEHMEIDKRIERVQDSIENLLNEKKTCHDKASHYLTKKMYPVTSYYSELSSNYRRMIETKTRKLIDLLLLKSENANTIDLHGLSSIQAKLVVTELLNIRQNQLSIDKQGKVSIDIITGWGKHTIQTGQHRIRPTIVALLREKGYEYYHLNKGALRVTIRR